MANSSDCKQNTDPLRLIHEGTNQDSRSPAGLDLGYSPIDERRLEHALVFAKAYAGHLKFERIDNSATVYWTKFFSADAVVQLAVAATQDVEDYKSNLKASFDFLNDRRNDTSIQESQLKYHLGYLFSAIATLALHLDELKEQLPNGIPLKATLQNLIKNQLASGFGRLIAYFEGGKALGLIDTHAVYSTPILGGAPVPFASVQSEGLSTDWSNGIAWASYLAGITGDASVYGGSPNLFTQTNHIATHNLFTGVFAQFLKVYARIIAEAKQSLQQALTGRDDHEPHYALLLSFLRLFDHVRTEANTLTGRHLDFYYRDVLRLKEKPAEPGHAHLLVELAKQAGSHEFKQGELFKAGKDALNRDAFFANDRDLVANQAKVTSLKSIYRHNDEKIQSPSSAGSEDSNRIYASPVANSDDGLGPALTSVDQSWHPFFNKAYLDGKLSGIKMPKAELGFAVASHYLWLSGGTRTITLTLSLGGSDTASPINLVTELTCLLSSPGGWLELPAKTVTLEANDDGEKLELIIELAGGKPAITPYDIKKHGYGFDTDLPVLLVKILHTDHPYIYHRFRNSKIKKIGLTVNVIGLKPLALSNDFGAIDASKPFQPFGALPKKGSSLILGSNEAFHKQCSSFLLNIQWQTKAVAYGTSPAVNLSFLAEGDWSAYPTSNSTFLGADGSYELNSINGFNQAFSDTQKMPGDEFYNINSRQGYLRITLSDGLGQADYLAALRTYLIAQSKTPASGTNPTPVPQDPVINAVSVSYTAGQVLGIGGQGSTSPMCYFHLGPFGQTQQTVEPNKTYLLPQFNWQDGNNESEAEFYIGVTGLKPAQNLALYFKIADGTANPLVEKPRPHLHWSYLGNNEWQSFDEYTVEDGTGGLLNSGIITFAVPDDATSTNTLLPTGQHWLKAAVADRSDAVCRLQMVAAQGFAATFKNQANDPAFSAKPLEAGTISKLAQPDAAVKSVSQPFPSFGGKGQEEPNAFYTRVSERLRHKDRAIALWDYEHLLLDAFPQIYQAKCLNHTRYEPGPDGTGIYQELAPGHVTVVTIPNQELHNLRDPLRPSTSLGLLVEIEAFLQKRLSCFIKLHVRNPVFEEVTVDFWVRFLDGYDDTFYKHKLDGAITQFLSPWAFSGGGKPSFGGKIYRAVLINFVEEQPYVDYVTDFKLSHSYKSVGNMSQEELMTDADVAEIAGSKAISLLVSARHHNIWTINPAQGTAPSATCPCASV
ncbi:baseplate J/gp47 family protein [Methylovulum miyakonense]|uniref:baseplate J/gp47 family protein n=1 Tax=Methylovulum miyakonense TaxID=645578 RepID=UPI00036C62BE|nr:baseplate J/gp47 family protein [Methylovulum miyakonense]